MSLSRKKKILITTAAGISVGVILYLLWNRHKNAADKDKKIEWLLGIDDSQPLEIQEPQLPAKCDFISSTELQNLLKTQSHSDFVMFDVRDKLIDYSGGHIINSINISDKEFYDSIPDIIKHYNNKSQLIIYCMYGARRSIKCIEFYSKAICELIENYSKETTSSYYFMYHAKSPNSPLISQEDNINRDDSSIHMLWMDEHVVKKRIDIDFCDDILIENLSKQKMMILKGGYFEFLNGLMEDVDSLQNITTGNMIKDFDESKYEQLALLGLFDKNMWYHKNEYFAKSAFQELKSRKKSCNFKLNSSTENYIATNRKVETNNVKSKMYMKEKSMKNTQKQNVSNDTTALEKEIVRNEKLYRVLSNDTSILESEIIRNEEIWRNYVKSLPLAQQGKQHNEQKSNQSNDKQQRSGQNNDNNNNNDNGNNKRSNNYNNNNGGDEKKDEDDRDEKNNDEREYYDIGKLKEKMKKIKTKATYIKIKNTKHALNDNELMAVMYYCDSESACSKMKKAHRCIIKDKFWKETYYHCTNAVEKIYQVLHYKNDEWKHNSDMSQKLYHGSTINILSVYDKEQFFFKTMISVSTKDYIAIEFAANKGMIFIIDKGFDGLYEGKLRGANVQWLSDFQEYEYIILPTTYNKINELHEHGLSLHPRQNVYITCYFQTNKNPLLPHSDTVSSVMQIDYTEYENDKGKNYSNDYTKIVEEDNDANVIQQRRGRINQQVRRSRTQCNLNGCDFEHHDTIPSTQLDINVFNTAELQHIKTCHPDFYMRLKVWTQPEWEDTPVYFIEITLVDLTGFNIQLVAYEANSSAKKYFVKEIGGEDDENSIGNIVRIKKGKLLGDTEIQLDEKRNEYYLGLYENKEAKHIILNSNVIHLVTMEDDSCIPQKNMNYKPKCIDLSTVRITKDEKNKKVNLYWDIPMYSFGEISYKIINDNTKKQEIISILPYPIPFPSDILSLKVTTITTIDDKVYASEPSQAIIINVNDQHVEK